MAVTRRHLPNGLDVAQIDAGETALLYREIFVERTYSPDGFPSGDPEVIFDIGANIGLASIFFKQRFPYAFILAVEPTPDAYVALRQNIAQHVRSGITRNVAVAARNEVRRFGYYSSSPSMSGLYIDPAADTELTRRFLVSSGLAEQEAGELSRSRHQPSFFECQTLTLSRLIRESGVDQIDLLKVDVEKSELDVLLGIEDPDWPKIREIVLEVHDIGGRLAHIIDLLRGRGFEVMSCQDKLLFDTDIHKIFAINAT